MNKKTILVAGAGHIGSLIALMLAQTQDYQVFLIDITNKSGSFGVDGVVPQSLQRDVVDVNDEAAITSYIQKNKIQSVISCLPYFCNEALSTLAAKNQLNYFDLTEDTQVFETIKKLAQNAASAFVPQCGVAPGFINIVSNDLIKQFNPAKAALMCVGALPAYPHNALKYALTWSTDGLINEYGNPCYCIKEGKRVLVSPLHDLETILIDGVEYEAFNTSGGVGNLTSTYEGKIQSMSYKTLRYPGHCEKIRLLMNELQLNKDRETLKKILENAVPKTNQDVVVIYVAVEGMKHDEFVKETFVKKIYPQTIANVKWSAIQIATATSACAVVDLVHQLPTMPKGLVLQESITLEAFLKNRFGKYYL